MSTPPKRRPTLDEVARTAGVSRAAASRALNRSGHVSRATREAVERAVRELDYVPNPTARALATQRAEAVVLAVSHHDPELFADPFHTQVLVGVSAVLERTDLVLMLVLADSDHGRARLERILRARRADGLMLLSLHGDDPLHHLADKTDLPVVCGGRPLGAEPHWYVDADNRGGARLATEHLIGLGRRRVATITGLLDTDVGVQRLRGHQEALAVAGLDTSLVAEADFNESGGYEAARRLLDQHPDLDAIFAASDNMAAGALRALRDAGRGVPDDVSVVGFDDAPVAGLMTPRLTTVRQPIRQLGSEMARMLLALINGEDPSPLILPTRLVVRESTAPARQSLG
ncbi:LacI family DNA-binding transcriptional regulator [Streptomyces sp. NPDC090306]|uniref:LacI family DNA-binding transcriptional regulator n=1 Tax=Streptomyces sp. NPDC090306 TaxID=3365961 RepID=UPI0037F95AE4